MYVVFYLIYGAWCYFLFFFLSVTFSYYKICNLMLIYIHIFSGDRSGMLLYAASVYCRYQYWQFSGHRYKLLTLPYTFLCWSLANILLSFPSSLAQSVLRAKFTPALLSLLCNIYDYRLGLLLANTVVHCCKIVIIACWYVNGNTSLEWKYCLLISKWECFF